METKICNKCGMELPVTNEWFSMTKANKDGFRGYCKKCEAKYKKQYRESNKEKVAKDLRNYYEEHKGKIKEYSKKYGEVYRAEHKEHIKEYRESNKEKTKEYKKQYYIKNKIKLRMQHRKCWGKYYLLNKDKVNGYTKKRRSIKKGLVSTLTNEEWVDIKNNFDNKCAYCGKEEPLTQEHFIPLSKGGEYTINNIIPACKSCNASKNDKSFFKWYKTYKYYSKKREHKILEYLKYKGEVQQLSLII